MKRFVLLLSMLCALASAWPATAQRGDRYSRDNDQQRNAQQDRDSGGRYARQDDYQNRDARQREQLSREQKEQLRRDISDHGREIYRERRSDRDRR